MNQDENSQPVNNLTPEQEVDRQNMILADEKKRVEAERFQQIVKALKDSIFIIFKQAISKLLLRLDVDNKKDRKYSAQMQIVGLTMWNELSLNMFFETLKQYYPPQAKEYGINLLNHKLAKHGIVLLEVKQPELQEVKQENKEEKNDTGNNEPRVDTGAANTEPAAKHECGTGCSCGDSCPKTNSDSQVS